MSEIKMRRHTSPAAELKSDEIFKILNQLPSGSNVTFTGGEIFMKEGIDEILTMAAAEHNVTFASNGVLLGKHAQLIVESGVQAVGISLDGPPEIHERIRNRQGIFDKLQRSLSEINYHKNRTGRRFPYINFNSVILKENYFALSEVVKYANDMGADSCTFQVFDPSLDRSGLSLQDFLIYDESAIDRVENIESDAMKESLMQLIQEGKRCQMPISFLPDLNIDDIVRYYRGQFNLEKWQCFLPWTTMRISPYGDVYPCLNYLIGNIRTDSLDKMWNHIRYRQFRQALKGKEIFNACTGCCKIIPKR